MEYPDLIMLTEEEILSLDNKQQTKNDPATYERKKSQGCYQNKKENLFFNAKELDNQSFNDKIENKLCEEKDKNCLQEDAIKEVKTKYYKNSIKKVNFCMGYRGEKRNFVTIKTIPLGKESSLTISETHCAGNVVAICSISGYLDQSNSELFQSQLISMVEFGVRFFVIDLELAYMVGSSGWGTLAMLSKLIKNMSGHLIACELKKEVEESFYLLQFNKIIEVRTTLEESLKIITLNIEENVRKNSDGKLELKESQFPDSCSDLPLPEKIKDIIARYGEFSFFKILARLKEDRYGRVNINPIKLFFMLKELNLDTKWKRLRFYRSC